MDAGNLLKPMVGLGELCCIGATTLNGYRKYIKKDPAVERRFQQVFFGQPSVVDTISILHGLRERYELHHCVKISDSALVSAAVLSDRYITERILPDKAIDLVDEAAAKLKMEITSKPIELDENDRAILKLEMEKFPLKIYADKASKERLSKLESNLASLKEKQKKFADQWEYEKGIMTRIRSIKEEENIRRMKTSKTLIAVFIVIVCFVISVSTQMAPSPTPSRDTGSDVIGSAFSLDQLSHWISALICSLIVVSLFALN